MLTVHLHLSCGDVIELHLSPSEKARVSRTLNQARLPTRPFLACVDDTHLEIPWRSIAYLTSQPQAQTGDLTLMPAI